VGGLELHLWLLLYLATFALPFFAAVGTAIRFGRSNNTELWLIGLGSVGVLGFAVFWAYLLNPQFGHVLAFALLLGALGAFAASLRLAAVRAAVLHLFAIPWIFFALYCSAILSVGFLHGGIFHGFEVANARFNFGLPGDNQIPYDFAQQLHASSRPLPQYVFADWQSSDRPPLQTGIYLLQIGWSNRFQPLDYEICGVIQNGSWVLGVFAICRALKLARGLTYACLAITVCSGLTIVNTFFTWPKLLPVTYLLLLIAALLTSEFDHFRRSRVAAVAFGVGLGCALLCHPGSLFFALGLVFVALAWRRVSWTLVIAGAVATIVTYVPWMAYQKWYQPPGDKLTMLQLANADRTQPGQSSLHEIVRAYQNAGLAQVKANKRRNLDGLSHEGITFLRTAAHVIRGVLTGNRDRAAEAFARAELFYWFTPILGLMVWAPIVLVAYQLIRLALRRPIIRGEALRFALAAGTAVVITLIVWALILFGPTETSLATVVHQGTYAVEILGLMVGVICFWWVNKWLAIAATALQALLHCWLYLAMTPDQTKPPLFIAGISGTLCVTLAIAVAGMVGLGALEVNRNRLGRKPLA
jgi:hypothetical protein